MSIALKKPQKPKQLGSIKIPGNSINAYVSGTTAYVVNGVGFAVVDVSNPSRPRLLATYDTPGSTAGIYVSGATAYVTAGGAGLQIIGLPSKYLQIRALNPGSGSSGKKVIIKGSDFGNTQGRVVVVINNVETECDVVSWKNTSITVTVPSGAKPGKVKIFVETADGFRTGEGKMFVVKKK